MSPEVLSQGPVQVYVGETSMTSDQPPSSSKADVWSLGIILIEIILVRVTSFNIERSSL